MKKAYSGNLYCPCGSGKKYKGCCQAKGIEYFVKPSGKLVKLMPLTAEQKAHFESEKQKFMETHGRKPTEEEEAVMRTSLYEDVGQVIARDLATSGAPPEKVYAFEKTGLWVTRENEHQVSPEELRRWEEAIEEYRLNQALNRE
ncbi:MAG TPA: SEC-C domain-containing protein [Candidatus Obscuribacterales bacterium]